MILGRARALLAERKRMSLDELAVALDAKPDAVDGMMDVLKQSGRVRELPCGKCGGCTGCALPLRIFEWI